MKTALLTLALALVAPLAHAQTPDIIAGGPRQELDKATCSAYRPTWEEFDTFVASIPETYVFGPEAPIPAPPAENTNDPEATFAVQRLMLHGLLNAGYSGRTGWSVAGHDQYLRAFEIAYALPEAGAATPRLPSAVPESGTWSDPVKLRDYRIRSLVVSLSRLQVLSVAQLDAIRAVLRLVPTCAGGGY